MTASANPPFIEQDGDPQTPAPFTFRRVASRSVPILAGWDRLKAFCDRHLNVRPESELGFRYLPFGPLEPGGLGVVYVVANEYGYMISDVPEFHRMGHARQNELYPALLVVKWVDLMPEELALFLPYCFVDNAWSVISGREVLGYPKVGSWITIPPPADPYPIRLETLAHQVYDPANELKRHLALEIDALLDPPTTPADPAGPETWPLGDVESLFGEKSEHRVDEAQLKLAREANRSDSIAMVQFKQFRDAEDPSAACYQAIVGSTMSLTALVDYSPLPPAVVRFHQLASLPMVEALGIVEPAASVVASYFETDFRLGDVVNLWTSTG